MLNVLVLTIAMMNYGNTPVAVQGYTYSTNVEFSTEFVNEYQEDEYLCSLQSTFQFTVNLKFNAMNDYDVSITSSNLYSNFYVYDEDGEIVHQYAYSGTVSSTIPLGSFASPQDIVFRPASTPQGFAYAYSVGGVQKGNFFMADVYTNLALPSFHIYKFSSGALSGYCSLVKTMLLNNQSYWSGYDDGFVDGSHSGYQTGLTDGIREGSSQDQTALTIFTGICEVGLLPVNVFLGILNFEVFGINIGGFVASLMTVAIVVIVVRIFLGGNKQND